MTRQKEEAQCDMWSSLGEQRAGAEGEEGVEEGSGHG